MFEIDFILDVVRKVIQNEALLEQAVLYALEVAYEEHKKTKGITDTTSQAASYAAGWGASVLKFASAYAPLQNLMMTENYKKRLKNVGDIKDEVRSRKISPMMGLWKIGQEGHWSLGGGVYPPSFNTKAIRYFILYCIEQIHNVIVKDNAIEKNGSSVNYTQIDMLAKETYQKVVQEHLFFPDFYINKTVDFNSRECSHLLVSLGSSSHVDIFKKAVIEAGRRAYLEFKGTYWAGSNYKERLTNTDNILINLEDDKLDVINAFRLLADEGEWNVRPGSDFNSFNTMFIAYVLDWLARNLPSYGLLDDYLYKQMNKPENKDAFFGRSKNVFSDYMQIGIETYKQCRYSQQLSHNNDQKRPSCSTQNNTYVAPPPSYQHVAASSSSSINVMEEYSPQYNANSNMNVPPPNQIHPPNMFMKQQQPLEDPSIPQDLLRKKQEALAKYGLDFN
ncbi:Ewing's tumor-associated antigen 1 [Thiotrichales bacterium 19S9-12]|nr:Ewing's tumor-associated antigen 1 [Thiotrichales bacterium 19S9-11]MCF6811270.1 Ewing's tumor-associated antigen 1 [Thiotrichales bacterium 19S9-12]